MKNDLHSLGTSQIMRAKPAAESTQLEYKNVPQIEWEVDQL